MALSMVSLSIICSDELSSDLMSLDKPLSFELEVVETLSEALDVPEVSAETLSEAVLAEELIPDGSDMRAI